ncbi:helix-turn-helix domain-containing protein [Domibacillus indicus]|uniref:helix-turn-helix domain-containing protein n=1 Tax=Domibacillus indicus TaxID=1437523 RepID=UPI000617CA1D|nr:helix-turn-helix domain-containing protein [Domibacillus indicus]
MNKNMEDYPIVLTVEHLAEILKVSKPKAYQIMDGASFPLIKLGRNKRVTREAFFEWLSCQEGNKL